MSKAGIAELKANLSAYLRRVRAGETIIIMDRDTAVARIVGVDQSGVSGLRVRQAWKPMASLAPMPALKTRSDIVELLLEERGER